MAEPVEYSDLEALGKQELLEYLVGGVYSILVENEEYQELIPMAAALGIQSFVRERMSGLDKNEILEMFLDGEAVLHELVRYGADQGMVDTGD